MKKKTQLFLLHFAGGNYYSFQFLMPHLTDFEVIPVELPGRGRRSAMPLIYDFDKAVKDIYEQILVKIESPFIIYGHSLGASIGLHVCDMLNKVGVYPSHLIVSGNAGPGIGDFKERHTLEKEEFKKELKLLGGVPDEFIEDTELFDFFEPILRADFQIAENKATPSDLRVKTPIYAIMGDQEDDVEDISNWKNFTRARFDAETLEGDHFFIHKHPVRIAQILKQCSNRIRAMQSF